MKNIINKHAASELVRKNRETGLLISAVAA